MDYPELHREINCMAAITSISSEPREVTSYASYITVEVGAVVVSGCVKKVVAEAEVADGRLAEPDGTWHCEKSEERFSGRYCSSSQEKPTRV